MNVIKRIFQTFLGIGFIILRAVVGLALTSFLVYAALFYTPGGGEREHVMVIGDSDALKDQLLLLQKSGYELILVADVAKAQERLSFFAERVQRLHRSIASEVQLVLVANPGRNFHDFYVWLQNDVEPLKPLPVMALNTHNGKATKTNSYIVLHNPNGEMLQERVISLMLPRKQLLEDFWRWVRFFPGYDAYGRSMAEEVWGSTWRTLYLVGGSLLLSLVVALGMVALGYFWSEKMVVRTLFSVLNIFSGLHILIIGLAYVIVTGNIGSFTFGMLIILALGNGTLSDYVAILREEIGRIFSQDYVLAAQARGSSRIWNALRETVLTLVDVTVAKIPLLVGSTIILEVLCSYYGLGWYIVKAIGTDPRDVNLTMVTTTLIVGGLIGVNLVSEAVRMALDPRVKG
jgi:ABC-type dipeptide/oligopeptide/nickel transport system permease component